MIKKQKLVNMKHTQCRHKRTNHPLVYGYLNIMMIQEGFACVIRSPMSQPSNTRP